MELWRCTAGVWTSRYGDRELWRRAARQEVRSSGDALLDVLVWRSGALETRCRACRRRDVEV